MPRTPDRRPGQLVEDDGLVLTPGAIAPTQNGEVRYVSGSGFRVYEEGVERGLAGISLGDHENIDSLVHEISESSYIVVTRDGNGRVANITTQKSSVDTTKIREVVITRSANLISQVDEKQYNGAGTLIQTLTSAITRTSGRVSSITVTES